MKVLLVLSAAALLASQSCNRPAAPSATGSATDSATEAAGKGLVILNEPTPYVTPGREDQVNDRPYFHDFGRVPYGTQLEHLFRLKNTDAVPVTIHDLLPSCGCATPQISYTTSDGETVRGDARADGPLLTVPPGAQVEVLVRIDTHHVRYPNRDKLATIRLRSDSVHEPYMTFEMHLIVDRLFQATPSRIELHEVPQSVGATVTAAIALAQPGSQAMIEGVFSVEGPLEASVSVGEQLGRPLWTVLIVVEPGLPLGALEGAVYLTTRGFEGEQREATFDVHVTGRIVPDVIVDPPALYLDALTRGDTAQAVAELRALIPGARVALLGARVEGQGADLVRVEFEAVDPDAAGRSARWRVTLRTLAEVEPTRFAGEVHLELDDPALPEIVVPFSGALR